MSSTLLLQECPACLDSTTPLLRHEVKFLCKNLDEDSADNCPAITALFSFGKLLRPQAITLALLKICRIFLEYRGVRGYFFIAIIGLVGRVFANGPGDLSSIPRRVIPNTFKMALDTSLLNTHLIRYVSRVKWGNPGKGVAPPYTSV